MRYCTTSFKLYDSYWAMVYGRYYCTLCQSWPVNLLDPSSLQSCSCGGCRCRHQSYVHLASHWSSSSGHLMLLSCMVGVILGTMELAGLSALLTPPAWIKSHHEQRTGATVVWIHTTICVSHVILSSYNSY